MSEEISREEIAALLARESEKMTREQAIGVITLHREHWQRLMKGNVCSKQEGEESIAAFDVALAALSAEPCEDAISRQAAIDAIGKDVMGGLNYVGILTRLPSVTPKQGPCVWCADIKKYKLRIEYYWIDEWDRPASLDPTYDHFVRREIARFCPNCGRKLESEEQA